MTVAELREIGLKLFGYGWQTRIAEALGINPRTVRTWVAGADPVPGPASVALRLMLKAT